MADSSWDQQKLVSETLSRVENNGGQDSEIIPTNSNVNEADIVHTGSEKEVDAARLTSNDGSCSTEKQSPVDCSLFCEPSVEKGASGGWGSWAASLLTNALQLDDESGEEDNNEVQTTIDPITGDIVTIQPQPAELHLPSKPETIERGANGDIEGESNGATAHNDEEGSAGYYYNLPKLSAWGTGWVSSALSNAKEKSASAAVFLKRDLNEFASVVKKDTSELATTTTKTLQTTLNVSDESVGKLKGDVSHLLGTVGSTLYNTTAQLYSDITAEEEEEQLHHGEDRTGSEPTNSNSGGVTSVENTFESKCEALYKDPNTYLTDPSEVDSYEQFKCTFKTDSIKQEISSLLISNLNIRLLYSRLVPSQVSHADFWARLWFKRQCIETEMERKSELLSKVQTSLHGDLPGWEDDEEEEDDVTRQEASQEDNQSSGISSDAFNEKVIEEKTPNEMENCSIPATLSSNNEEDEPVHVGTPPDSSTSDEWEKDFDDCQS